VTGHPEALQAAINAVVNDAHERGVTLGLTMATLKAQRADTDAPEWETIRKRALNAVTVTDPTGHQMRPADVTAVLVHASVDTPSGPVDAPWGVALDWGPFRSVIPVFDEKTARAVALAFIHLLRCDYDLSALDGGTDEL